MPEAPRNNAAKTREDGRPVGKPFAKGNPGRPKGSRNALGEAFLKALHEDFAEHGVSAVEQVRVEKPDQYLKVVASILPKELNVNVNDAETMSDDAIIQRIRELDSIVQPFLAIAGETGTGSGSGSSSESTAH